MRFTFYLAVSYSIILGTTSEITKIGQMFILTEAALGQLLRQIMSISGVEGAFLTCLAPLEKNRNLRVE